jgi:hypothetical protein
VREHSTEIQSESEGGLCCNRFDQALQSRREQRIRKQVSVVFKCLIELLLNFLLPKYRGSFCRFLYTVKFRVSERIRVQSLWSREEKPANSQRSVMK